MGQVVGPDRGVGVAGLEVDSDGDRARGQVDGGRVGGRGGLTADPDAVHRDVEVGGAEGGRCGAREAGQVGTPGFDVARVGEHDQDRRRGVEGEGAQDQGGGRAPGPVDGGTAALFQGGQDGLKIVLGSEELAEPLTESQTEGLEGATYVTFTSSSTVRFFLAGGGAVPDRARVASIGPVTSATLREHGLEPDVEAERHDIDGLVAALTADVAARRVGAS